MPETPEVIARYIEMAAANDTDGLLECFTDDAVVVDERQTHRGKAEIRAWREGVASRWTYTSTIGEIRHVGDHVYLLPTHIEGNFPGGVADLEYEFTLRGHLIETLDI